MSVREVETNLETLTLWYLVLCRRTTRWACASMIR